MKIQAGFKIVVVLFFCSLVFCGSAFATLGDTSRQTEKFKAKNKMICDKKIDRFLTKVTPYSLGPDGGPGIPGECMRCSEIKRTFKKPPPGDFTRKPICRVVGECVVVEDSYCSSITPGSGD